ncbi:hypothetical protein GCM10011369_23480 [Neiella marina]|uniref:Uncharacterized protein n=1 Tax=Neiella marina TaxID=508461 RepID=A0A8J2U5Z7_9GAMM|nr:hypothetical protein [Neiella marina]GGA80817.1 hypothetical protein GCM10011369_23480 [Neiella marina]
MQVIQLLSFRMNDTDFYYTDIGTSYNYGGNRYLAGSWAGLDSFEMRSAPAINEHSITLNDPDLALTITSYAGKWQWQPLSVRWLILDDAGNLEDDFMVLQGAITQPDANGTDSNRTLVLRVQENHTLELVHGHRTNTASQHSLVDSSDNCFEMLPFLDGVKLPWGKDGNGVVYVPNNGSNSGNTESAGDRDFGYRRNPQYSGPSEAEY